MRRWSVGMVIVMAGVLVSQTRHSAVSKEDLLWRHRNRGKAFYENPTAQTQAVEEFRKAFALAPDSARERLNYGLALLRAVIEEVDRAQRLR